MPLPEQALIRSYSQNAYFMDSFQCSIANNNQSALAVFLAIARNTPSWVNYLMSLRNRIVSLFGLKNLGHIGDIDFNKPENAYQVGDRIGIFTLFANSRREVILEDRDKHLQVKVSFYLEPNGDQITVHATTVVHVNNRLGKVYMFFVGPIHKMVVPSSLKTLTSKTHLIPTD